MEEKIINKEALKNLCKDILADGNNLIAPNSTEYVQINNAEDIMLEPSARPTKASYKTFVFPKAEPVIYYKRGKNDVQLLDVDINQKKTVILGAKPCDANSFNILRHLFNWDYKDEFYNLREKNFVVIGLMCSFSDEYCFCTSVGSSPVSEKGSDIFLIPLDESSYAVRVATEKEKSLRINMRSILHRAIKRSRKKSRQR